MFLLYVAFFSSSSFFLNFLIFLIVIIIILILSHSTESPLHSLAWLCVAMLTAQCFSNVAAALYQQVHLLIGLWFRVIFVVYFLSRSCADSKFIEYDSSKRSKIAFVRLLCSLAPQLATSEQLLTLTSIYYLLFVCSFPASLSLERKSLHLRTFTWRNWSS